MAKTKKPGRKQVRIELERRAALAASHGEQLEESHPDIALGYDMVADALYRAADVVRGASRKRADW